MDDIELLKLYHGIVAKLALGSVSVWCGLPLLFVAIFHIAQYMAINYIHCIPTHFDIRS